jgi:hypothetical protein
MDVLIESLEINFDFSLLRLLLQIGTPNYLDSLVEIVFEVFNYVSFGWEEFSLKVLYQG